MAKKLPYLLLVLGLLFCGLRAEAQTQLTGIATDGETKEALIGLTVQVVGTQMGAATDFEGKYQLQLPTAGKYQLRCSYTGYEAQILTVEVDGITPKTLDIAMSSGVMGDVVVVTEGKYEKKLEESTVSIDVVTPKMLENNVITGLDEAVKKVSGVQMMDGQVNIRGGAGYAFGAGSRVAFLVDGQPLLSAELSDIKWNFVPLENAEQIEVIKGSASVLYGSGALNGVINVRTAYATEKPYTSFSLYTGIHDQPGVDSMRWYDFRAAPKKLPQYTGFFVAHRSQITPQLHLVAGANAHFANGYIQGFDERRLRGNFHLSYRPKKDSKWLAGLRGNGMYHAVFTFFLARDMENGAFLPIAENSLDKYMSISLDPYFTLYDKSKNKHNFNGRWFVISKLRGSSNPSVGNTFNFEYQFQRQWENGWSLTAGAMYQFFHVNSILFDDNQAGGDDRALFTGQNAALYAQVDKKIGERLNITVGLRSEYFKVDTNSVLTPPVLRVGANYQLGKDGYLRASFGQGFRFPSLAERFINEPIAEINGLNLSAFPNHSLRPELGWSSEIAFRQVAKINDRYRFYVDAAIFWMEYTDMVEFQLGFYPEGLGFKSVNIAEARIAGWEISTFGDGKIGKFPLRIWGGYTYSCPVNLAADTSMRNVGNYMNFLFTTFAKGIAIDDTDNINRLLKYRSIHNVRLDLETEYKGFILGGVANYNSYVHGVDLVFQLGIIDGFNEFRAARQNGDWVFDLRLGYKFNDRQRLNFVVTNVANRVYAFRPARVEAPRTFALKYMHTF
jgi:iron complex outermembrane receptor protein